MQRHAPHQHPVDFQDPVVVDPGEDVRTRPANEFLVVYALPDEAHDSAHVLFEDPPHLLVLVGVDHRPDPLVTEHLREQRFINEAVQQVNTRGAAAAGARTVIEFRSQVRVQLPLFQNLLGFDDGKLAHDLAVHLKAVFSHEINHFHRPNRLGHFEGDAVGIDAESFALAIKTDGRDNGDNPLIEKQPQRVAVHPFHLAGVKIVHSAPDTKGVGDDGVGVGRPKVDGGQALHDFVGDANGGVDGKPEGRLVRNAGSIRI